MEKATSKFSALIFGPTGAIGRELVLELLSHPQWERVAVVTRRELDEWKTLTDEQKSRLVIIKRETLDDIADMSKWKDTSKYTNLFSCLGTTRGKDGKQGQWKIDHDYAIYAGQLAKSLGIPQYSIVTSQGADKSSFFSWYLEMKGKIEFDLEQMKFPTLSIFRPGLLLNRRGEERTVEKIFSFVPLISKASTKEVAAAMRREAEWVAGEGYSTPRRIYENKDILRIARDGQIQKAK